jgi:putative oxidoreductase
MRFVKLLGAAGLWLLQILIAVGFVLIGIAKFADPSWARKFERWGYPDGFYMVIGALEAAGGIALLVPRLTSYTAVLLCVIMIGASLTHWLHGEMARVTPPLMYLAVLIIVGLGRWRSAIGIRSLRRPTAQLGPV